MSPRRLGSSRSALLQIAMCPCTVPATESARNRLRGDCSLHRVCPPRAGHWAVAMTGRLMHVATRHQLSQESTFRSREARRLSGSAQHRGAQSAQASTSPPRGRPEGPSADPCIGDRAQRIVDGHEASRPQRPSPGVRGMLPKTRDADECHRGELQMSVHTMALGVGSTFPH